jgi:nucleotide-binding universal stress UspA family protein
MVVSHDPTVDVDDALMKAVSETGADLVVMASHVPGLADYIWPSNGGKLAAHSSASVFVVRD